MLDSNSVPPSKVADTLCEPTSVEVVKLARPRPSTGTVVCTLPSRRNVTLPVGCAVPGGTTLTCAVNVFDSPNSVEELVDVSDIVVLALVTVCRNVLDGPALKL